MTISENLANKDFRGITVIEYKIFGADLYASIITQYFVYFNFGFNYTKCCDTSLTSRTKTTPNEVIRNNNSYYE